MLHFFKLLRSFAVGISGFLHAVATEQNLKIHCLIALVVITAGCLLPLATWEWLVVTLCIGLVISAECLNTALERLADRVTSESDPLIKQAKDCGSAAVLVLAITAAIVGIVVFVPKIWAATGW